MPRDSEEPLLSPEGIQRIARLARLRIEPEDLGRWGVQMMRIVDHVRKLREIPDGELPEPAAPPETTLRLDEASPGDGRQELAANAGQLSHGLAPVPRVVDPAR
ncbi:MAG: Asp-tRNA(Asn)/Glu-tRNA(Gln) amidotransferase subunit GatC [Thermoanaerobaculia bacterium]